MATTTNKQQFLNQVFTQLKKKYDRTPEPVARPVLEHLIYAICREGTTSEQADIAFRKLKEGFFDWNEVRVSSETEIEEAMANLPNRSEKALQLIKILQEIFELTFSFDMEDLDKKGLKVASKQLSRYQALKDSDFVIAWVIQHGLGGHAIPLDRPALRVLSRLGLVEAEPESIEAARSSLENVIPKTRGAAFTEMLSHLALEICVETAPQCGSCPLKSDCPTGRAQVETQMPPANKSGRLKSR